LSRYRAAVKSGVARQFNRPLGDTTTRVYYDRDADLNLITGSRI
jgi:hypothetical protein